MRLSDILTELVERRGDREIPILSITKDCGIVLASERFGNSMQGRNLPVYRVAPRDSIALDPMLLWSGTIGRQKIVDLGAVSPDYRVYRASDDALPEFLEFAFKGHRMAGRFRSSARGTNVRRNRISRSDFAALTMQLPPLPEQRKIAAILSSVDEAIEKTQAVIDQVQVVKKGLMQELLTKGLPGRHKTFKQTEIGRIPESWEVRALGDFCDAQAGGTPSRGDPQNFGGDIPWVKSGEVGGKTVTATEETLTMRGLQSSSARWIPPGAVLVAMYGATAGQVGRLSLRATTNQAVLAVMARPEKAYSDFIYYLLESRGADLLGRVQGSGQPNLSKALICGLQVALPSLDEQREIARLLGDADSRVIADAGVLQVLRDLKSALMSVLLTGELRVRPDPPTPGPAEPAA
ncbi:MAG: restriction endonuclease subunit S [Nannocystaceae bacterium]